jgi:hypothetical protein
MDKTVENVKMGKIGGFFGLFYRALNRIIEDAYKKL